MERSDSLDQYRSGRGRTPKCAIARQPGDTRSQLSALPTLVGGVVTLQRATGNAMSARKAQQRVTPLQRRTSWASLQGLGSVPGRAVDLYRARDKDAPQLKLPER